MFLLLLDLEIIKLLCILCNATLPKEAHVPIKLRKHLEKSHPSLKNKPNRYFENLVLQKGKHAKKLSTIPHVVSKGLLASYKVAQLFGKQKSAHRRSFSYCTSSRYFC